MLDDIIDKNIIFLQNFGLKINSKQDKAVYKYGLQILYYYIIDLAVVFSLAYLFGRLYETMIMTFAFGLLQVFGGGYHAQTPLRCLITMVIGLAAGNILINIIGNYEIFMITSAIILSSIIFIIGPVKNKNHLVSKKVYKRSKFVSRSILLLIILMSAVVLHINKNVEAAALISVVYLYFISLVSAKLKSINHVRKCNPDDC